ncbi:hypothetical protein MUK72_19070 (plasmid) [Halococcus dombrowskii]|nr:hypothetical protein [Halococcus dombrowskii]UOO97258.1 hypothetical protein MUK72_19070 [Halococcus dombrowskii]
MSSDAGKQVAYLREKSPRILYNAAQRSWYERQIETPVEFLQACIATELADVLSEQVLQLLGEENLYPVAERFCRELRDNEITRVMRQMNQASKERTRTAQIEAAAQQLVRQRLLQVRSVVEEYYCDMEGLFSEFEEDVAAGLRAKRHAKHASRFEDTQILRDRFAVRVPESAVDLQSAVEASQQEGTSAVSTQSYEEVTFSAANKRHGQYGDEPNARPA